MLSFRPRTAHPYIASTYFVGASTHPGTGVPIVLAGAKLTAEQVLTDIGVSLPSTWSRGEKERWEGDVVVKDERERVGGVKELDRKVVRAWKGREVVASLMVTLLVGLVGALWVLVVRAPRWEEEGAVRLDDAHGTLRLNGLGY